MLFRSLFAALLVTISINAAHAAPQWLNLPPTPSLPKAAQSGFAPVNGIKIWYATFGRGEPVMLLHGGLANANYWGAPGPGAGERNIRSSSWTAAAMAAARRNASPMATI